MLPTEFSVVLSACGGIRLTQPRHWTPPLHPSSENTFCEESKEKIYYRFYDTNKLIRLDKIGRAEWEEI